MMKEEELAKIIGYFGIFGIPIIFLGSFIYPNIIQKVLLILVLILTLMFTFITIKLCANLVSNKKEAKE